MICPRWLVQSSAIGVVGVALVAMPWWMNPTSQDEEEELVLRQTSFQVVERSEEPASVRTVRRVQRDKEEDKARVVRMRYHLVDAHPGPYCPVSVETEHPEDLEAVRILIEQSRQQALQRYRDDHE